MMKTTNWGRGSLRTTLNSLWSSLNSPIFDQTTSTKRVNSFVIKVIPDILEEVLKKKNSVPEQFGKSAGEAENMQRQLQLLLWAKTFLLRKRLTFSDANNKLHETNESLRFALDNRAAVLRQFNLVTFFCKCLHQDVLQRTPSPSMYRDSPVGSLQSQSPLAGNLHSQMSQSNLGSYGVDDDGDYLSWNIRVSS